MTLPDPPTAADAATTYPPPAWSQSCAACGAQPYTFCKSLKGNASQRPHPVRLAAVES